ncbi:heme-binding protein [Rhizobium rhizogenes]|uniref:heme-binding protein n=1 Tax=Rhizobium rhizogenes TaxID=359 RepID=UPI0009B67C35
MNTAVAESLISIAQAEAARARFGMCITVLDATPHLVALARRDGANAAAALPAEWRLMQRPLQAAAVLQYRSDVLGWAPVEVVGLIGAANRCTTS